MTSTRQGGLTTEISEAVPSEPARNTDISSVTVAPTILAIDDDSPVDQNEADDICTQVETWLRNKDFASLQARFSISRRNIAKLKRCSLLEESA